MKLSPALEELIIRTAAYILIVMLSLSVALLEIFSVPAGPVIDGLDTSISWPLCIVLNAGLIAVVNALDPSRYRLIAALAAWTLPVFYFSSFTHLGYAVLQSTAPAEGFLILGLLSIGVPIVRTVLNDAKIQSRVR